MIEVIPFRLYHLDLLKAQGVQEWQKHAVSHVPVPYASLGTPAGIALTVRDGERIVICGGILHGFNPTLWAVLSDRASQHMLALTRIAERFLDTQPYRRIEASSEEDFPAGCRWLELLGFKFEGRMPGYGDRGETHLRYGLVRGDR